MLVLRRNCGQSIVIAAHEKITIKILDDTNGVISLGIEAPSSVIVDRLEVYRKRMENMKSQLLPNSPKENKEPLSC